MAGGWQEMGSDARQRERKQYTKKGEPKKFAFLYFEKLQIILHSPLL
jgi:hypothetical protein